MERMPCKEFLTYSTEFKRKFVFKLLHSKIDFFLLECTVLCILTCVDSCNEHYNQNTEQREEILISN